MSFDYSEAVVDFRYRIVNGWVGGRKARLITVVQEVMGSVEAHIVCLSFRSETENARRFIDPRGCLGKRKAFYQ